MSTSPQALINMYIFGAGIISALKIGFAQLGLYSAVNSGNQELVGEFIFIVLETMLPIFLTVDGGFVRVSEAFITIVLNIGLGITIAGLKYDNATRGRY